MLSFLFLTLLACLVTTSNTFSAESMNFTTVMYNSSNTDDSITSFEHVTDYYPSQLYYCADDPDTPDPELCFCYDNPSYPGVDRHWLITAMLWHCDRMTGGIGEPMAVYARQDGFYYGMISRRWLHLHKRDAFVADHSSSQAALRLCTTSPSTPAQSPR